MNKEIDVILKQLDVLHSAARLIKGETRHLNSVRLTAKNLQAKMSLEKILSNINENNLEFEDSNLNRKGATKIKNYNFRCHSSSNRTRNHVRIFVILPEAPKDIAPFTVIKRKWKGRPYELVINHHYNGAGELGISFNCNLPKPFFMQTVAEHIKKSGFKIKNM
jgi:hypothetical protein